ncbi:hypothetical protein LCGC14_1040280 [marine sediment metagenome]|uniref:Uncharacterized protein n=1 Tax=marine sediment metagenome TaxID=412755 RepID=A0A0F9MWF3_9ZZZZ
MPLVCEKHGEGQAWITLCVPCYQAQEHELVSRVLAIHQEIEVVTSVGPGAMCVCCREVWPCRTFKALGEAQ